MSVYVSYKCYKLDGSFERNLPVSVLAKYEQDANPASLRHLKTLVLLCSSRSEKYLRTK